MLFLTGPTGKRVHSVVKKKNTGVYQIEYIPTDVGEYGFSIKR